jgi:hypothetical protein
MLPRFLPPLLAGFVLFAAAACGGDTQAPPTKTPRPPSTPHATAIPPRSECTPSAQAASVVGRNVTVCGRIGGASYQSSTNGRPTFMNFDRDYPNHSFTALIWGDNRSRFSPPPEQQFAAGKNVCVTGVVELYRGKPQIIVRDPGAIKVC